MYDRKINLSESESAVFAITKDERYELIAQAAQGLKEFDELPDVEAGQVWDSNDIELDFVAFVSHCS